MMERMKDIRISFDKPFNMTMDDELIISFDIEYGLMCNHIFKLNDKEIPISEIEYEYNDKT